jgi:DNA-binding CsgD family transcriptional regulator
LPVWAATDRSLVAQGATNRQVAEQLFLSREPPFHLRDVFCKLGISSRHELGSFPS